MAHKGQSDPPVSLFSFQDIVTSLTGIMFLIVLLLSLILFSSHPEARRKAEADPEVRQLAEQLERRRKELRQLQERAAALAEVDPEELARRYEELQQKLRRQKAEDPAVEAEIAALTPAVERAQTARKQLQEELDAAEREAQQLADRKRQTEAALKAAETQKEENRKLLRFQVDAPTGKTVVVGICGKSSIEFRDAASGNAFTVPLSRGAASPELRTALAEFHPATQYFCLFFRPDSYDYAGALLELLKQSGFERGLEPLPANDNRLEFDSASGGDS